MDHHYLIKQYHQNQPLLLLKHVLHKLYTPVGHYRHNESDGNSSHDPLDYKKSDLNNYLESEIIIIDDED
jgi:hypothetical protein